MPNKRDWNGPERDEPEQDEPPVRNAPLGAHREPEPARWDAEGEFWVLLGTEEGQADAVVTVLGPVQGPR